MIECPNCHKKLEDGSLFCDECGTRIEVPQPQSPKKKESKKWIVIGVIAALVVIGVAAYMLLSTSYNENHIVAKAEESNKNKDYKTSLSEYSKMLSDDNSEEFYVGLANTVEKYMENSEAPIEFDDQGQDTFLEETFKGDINIYNFIEIATEKYPLNEELEKYEQEMDKRTESYKKLIDGLGESNSEKAQEKYNEAIRLNPENVKAKEALIYNKAEKYFKEEEWHDLYDLMQNVELNTIFVNDQKLDMDYTGEGYYISKEFAYKGNFKNGQFDGKGKIFSYTDTSLNTREVELSEGKIKPGHFLECRYAIEKDSAAVDWFYEGNINEEGNYDGTVQVEWIYYNDPWFDGERDTYGKGIKEFKDGISKSYGTKEHEGEKVYVVVKVTEASDDRFYSGERYWYNTEEEIKVSYGIRTNYTIK